MAGRTTWAARGVLGLAENPFSSMVCGSHFLVPDAGAPLMGLPAGERRRFPARLGLRPARNGPAEHYLRLDLCAGNDFPPRSRPIGMQDSSLLDRCCRRPTLLSGWRAPTIRRGGRAIWSNYMPSPAFFA